MQKDKDVPINDDRIAGTLDDQHPTGTTRGAIAEQGPEAELQELQERLRTMASDRSLDRRRLTDHLLKVQASLNATSRQVQRLEAARRLSAERHAAELDDLTRKTAALRYQRDVARWKLDSLRQRKWWRIGGALGSLRRQPLRLFSVLVEIARIVRSTSRPSRPPEPPAAAPIDGMRRASSVQPNGAAPPPEDVHQIPSRQLAVATALDQQTDRHLSFEWVSQPITAANWRAVLQDARPDLLLVSDVGWQRIDPGSSATSLWREIVDAYRDAGTPTVFWDTRRVDSASLQAERAELFDMVVCSFSSMVEAYRSTSRCENVHLFGPAVQTRLFRPASANRRGDVIGLRSLAAPDGEGPLARAARSISKDVVVHDQRVTDDPEGVESVADIAKDYKAAVVELSPATDEREIRHLLEVVATRTLVLAGGVLPDELDDVVFDATVPREAKEALKTLLLTEELRDRLSHRAWRQVRRQRSMTGRVDELLARAGVAVPRPVPKLTMMVPTNRPHKLATIMDNLGRQTYPELSALLVLHGVEIDEVVMREMADERGLANVDVLRVPGDVALGEVFNRGFAACEGDFVGKMDDDDHYGPEYASDLLADFEHTTADIVGKWTHYAYSQALDATLLRYPGSENSYQDLLAISTLIMRPSVLEEVSFLPMEKGSGSQFLREAAALGAKVYAGNRFNYLYNRYSGDGHTHTWPVADYEFAAKARFICQGQNLAAVEA